jgi:predicted GIY-YIG superfamily endonuclease
MACFRCGRRGHIAQNCYAKTAVDSAFFQYESSCDDESYDDDSNDYSSHEDDGDLPAKKPNTQKNYQAPTTTLLPRSTSSTAQTTRRSGIYVLLTTSGLYYVGKSNDIDSRIKDHQRGLGAACLYGSQFQEIPSLLTSGSASDLESWERNETLHRMLAHGIENVRGWMFTSTELSDNDLEDAFRQICEKFDLCRRCGRNSHFAYQCFARSLAMWAGAGPV